MKVDYSPGPPSPGESLSDLPADPAITLPADRAIAPRASPGAGRGHEDPDRPKRYMDGDAARFVIGQHFRHSG
jgi:hypothetical protein